jgi:hypothetical protein
MKREEVIEILTNYQEWRLGNIDDLNYTPKEISQALEYAIENL